MSLRDYGQTFRNGLPWLFRRGRYFWDGRDLRGHYTRPDTVWDVCRHRCCRDRKRRPQVPRRAHLSAVGPRVDGRTARKREAERLRTDYAAYLHAHYLDAEEETRGNMVTPAARRRGISGADFFRSGRRPSVERWGSDELRSWFGSGNVAAGRRGSRGGLLSLTDYRAAVTEQRAA